MNVKATELPGHLIIEPTMHHDERGGFQETYRLDRYAELGIEQPFVQHNRSWSHQNVVRGLHAQARHPQGKLIRVTHGSLYDVAVDYRPDSPTFKKWVAVNLDAREGKEIWIPPQYAHGFCVLSDFASVEYLCTDYYHPDDQLSIRWDDEELRIDWPVDNPVLSEKDARAPKLETVIERVYAMTPTSR